MKSVFLYQGPDTAEDIVLLRLQLGASQAREKVLREITGSLLAQCMDTAVANGANSVSMPNEYVEAALLLSQPADYTALKAGLAAERERCANAVDGLGLTYGHTCAIAIRALGD